VPNDHIFSPEYEPQIATTAEEPQEAELIEYQLEKNVKEEVKNYGTGKPRREFIRARVIHD
jgi:hypothetical protein